MNDRASYLRQLDDRAFYLEVFKCSLEMRLACPPGELRTRAEHQLQEYVALQFECLDCYTAGQDVAKVVCVYLGTDIDLSLHPSLQVLPPPSTMPPKKTPKKRRASSSSSSSSPTKNKINKKSAMTSDRGAVRQDSPGCGERTDEDVPDHAALKRMYLVTESDVKHHCALYALHKANKSNTVHTADKAIADWKREVQRVEDEKVPADLVEAVMYSMWWKTSDILLPTASHFKRQGAAPASKTAAGSDSIGLIRPINQDQAARLQTSFMDNNGNYNPQHPVNSCTLLPITHRVVNARTLVFLCRFGWCRSSRKVRRQSTCTS